MPLGPSHKRESLWPATSPNWRHAAPLFCVGAILLLFIIPCALASNNNDKPQYGTGLIASVDLPESEVVPVVAEIAQNGIIRGTKEYNKDEYITGAMAETTTKVFPAWTDSGKVFYKVRKQAIDPRNFKDSSDMGTLAVRYVVQPTGEKTTALRIDALFVEDYRHTVHASNGSVENSEYRDILEHLEGLGLLKEETEKAGEAGQLADTTTALSNNTSDTHSVFAPSTVGFIKPHVGPSSPAVPERSPSQTLEEYVQDLRRLAERRVKASGAPLKSAPFHMANTLKSLPAGTEVLIVISSSYWYGVETHDGQHGWMSRDGLEPLP
jgi:hypothetical protein